MDTKSLGDADNDDDMQNWVRMLQKVSVSVSASVLGNTVSLQHGGRFLKGPARLPYQLIKAAAWSSNRSGHNLAEIEVFQIIPTVPTPSA